MLSVMALNYLLSKKGGLFFLECNYDVKQANIKVKNDHRSKFSNLSNCKEEA